MQKIFFSGRNNNSHLCNKCDNTLYQIQNFIWLFAGTSLPANRSSLNKKLLSDTIWHHYYSLKRWITPVSRKSKHLEASPRIPESWESRKAENPRKAEDPRRSWSSRKSRRSRKRRLYAGYIWRTAQSAAERTAQDHWWQEKRTCGCAWGTAAVQE